MPVLAIVGIVIGTLIVGVVLGIVIIGLMLKPFG